MYNRRVVRRRAWGYVDNQMGVTAELTDNACQGEPGSLCLHFATGTVTTRNTNPRTVAFRFDTLLGSPASKPPVPLPNGRVNGIYFMTGLSTNAPLLNFNTMLPGEEDEVRIWIHFATPECDAFWLRPNQTFSPPIQSTSGVVHVVAGPDTNGDGKPDSWRLQPVDAGDLANLITESYDKRARKTVDTDFGDFRVPFGITFRRMH